MVQASLFPTGYVKCVFSVDKPFLAYFVLLTLLKKCEGIDGLPYPWMKLTGVDLV
jgi:hypothetical protein